MYLAEKIRDRQLDETLIQLRIATNPHLEAKDAQQFAEELMSMRRQRSGPDTAPIDRKGLALLKERLKNGSKAIRVK